MSPISAREAKIDDSGEYVNRRSRPKIAADKEKIIVTTKGSEAKRWLIVY